ncbi:MAG TPA: glucosidase [Thermoanaerobaculia bacterium]|nr:glucosidase [Thermoanaerobaculia bacterium]
MSGSPGDTAEGRRLDENTRRVARWNRWGPYLSERAWGTVREDYSADGAAWDSFPHDHARSRAYRWNEDGLGGVCDRHQLLCFALALWNGRDPILKERPFGLTNAEGNHGEDVKEYWFYLDSTPTHSFMRYLYKYPQAEYPYRQLLEENRRRTIDDPEYELLDTGIFDGGRYFDVVIEYAKAAPEDLLVEITAFNRAPDPAPIDLLPTVWFRNTWSWRPNRKRPVAGAAERPGGRAALVLDEAYLGRRYLHVEPGSELLFTENETNARRLFGSPNPSRYVKDAFHEYVIRGDAAAVNPARTGTKAAVHRRVVVPAGGSTRVRLRLTDAAWESGDPLGEEFERVFADRRREADDFYGALIPASLSPDEKNVMRQAFAGMLWSKQFYKYDVRRWLDGDPLQPPPPASRKTGRNSDWRHVFNADVLSMPDTWEFPWYAAWDLAFHCVVFSLLDANFAKEQLVLMLREWYMHPNGQIPAYEWNFADVNPPVHAWAALRVFQIERAKTGKADRAFLERVFHKLLLNFDWWVNRKDALGNNIFQGGFLGLDNIGIFDRNMKLPDGWVLSQADGTSWMAMYCLNLLGMALELAAEDPVYEDVASKFWEHFVYIAHAIQRPDQPELGLWDEHDGFFYDEVHHPDGRQIPIRVRSLVGLLPLTAVVVGDSALIDRFPSFKRRMEWFFAHRQDLTSACASMTQHGREERILMSVVRPEQLARVLRYMLDESEFLSPYGLRSVSRYHHDHPYRATTAYGQSFGLDYEPGESRTKLFGGNSNWRGPIWFPLNYLILESLKRYHLYFGDAFKIECPTGSGRMMNLHEVSQELARRLSRIFVADAKGRRAVFGDRELFRTDPHWKDLLLFHEYFHGDTGLGLGASHQTGWTGLVAKLLDELGSPHARTLRG